MNREQIIRELNLVIGCLKDGYRREWVTGYLEAIVSEIQKEPQPCEETIGRQHR